MSEVAVCSDEMLGAFFFSFLEVNKIYLILSYLINNVNYDV